MLRNCPPVLGVVRVLLGMTRCVGNWRGVGQASPGRVRLCVITCLNQVVCQSTLSNKCAVSRGVLLFYLFIFEWIWMLRRHGLGGADGPRSPPVLCRRATGSGVYVAQYGAFWVYSPACALPISQNNKTPRPQERSKHWTTTCCPPVKRKRKGRRRRRRAEKRETPLLLQTRTPWWRRGQFSLLVPTARSRRVELVVWPQV